MHLEDVRNEMVIRVVELIHRAKEIWCELREAQMSWRVSASHHVEMLDSLADHAHLVPKLFHYPVSARPLSLGHSQTQILQLIWLVASLCLN